MRFITRIAIFGLSLLSLLITGCFGRCRSSHKTEGLVEEQFSLICATTSSTAVINSDSAFRSILLFGCKGPGVDFSRHTLLGQRIKRSGCGERMVFEVKPNVKRRQYHYTITLDDCDRCGSLIIDEMRFVKVPKLPDGWRVTFHFRKSRFSPRP